MCSTGQPCGLLDTWNIRQHGHRRRTARRASRTGSLNRKVKNSMSNHHLRLRCLLSCLALVLTATSPVSAHFLWVSVSGDGQSASIIFEESPSPGDGRYLDPFVQRGKTWIRTVDQTAPAALDVSEVSEKGKRWLTATLPAAAPRSIDSYGKFGVYDYGDRKVLLHYYARNLDVTSHDDLHELARADHFQLDLVPHQEGQKTELNLIWRDRPAADRPVYIRGPDKFRKALKTDASGMVRFQAAGRGRFLIRSFVEEPLSGSDDGDDYSLIRHNVTLVLQLPLSR